MKNRCHGNPPANCCDDGSARSWFWRAAVCGAGQRPYVFSIHVQNEGNEEKEEKKNPFLHLLFVLRPVPKFLEGSSAFFRLPVFFATSLTLEHFWFCRASPEANTVSCLWL